MKITRKMILGAIIRRSGVFPNCQLKQTNEELSIVLIDAYGETAYIFKAKVPSKQYTYNEMYEYLLKNPQIKLISEKLRPEIKTTIEV